ncbi:MAG: hypothetical protein CVV27_19035 [Candidatus Melainabacteria bacterium HGW-Melainabacteria-1]|nr:MAG: hypothetical protein CVV27_19035 [Candidatus Melainabacteria bacterium HGW-Melainabacteria-1]
MPEAPSRIASIKEGKAPRILIVDDKTLNRDILARMLEPIGFLIRQAVDGQEAMTIVETWMPDIVLLDLVMPGLSGKGLIQALRSGKKGDTLKIIVTTASVSEFERVSAEELGADALIDKPVMEGLLFAEIRRLTGIEYDHEGRLSENSGEPTTEAGLTGKLAALPADMLVTLRDSIRLGDIEEIGNLALKIKEVDPELARAIAGMAESFQLDRLMKLADSIG